MIYEHTQKSPLWLFVAAPLLVGYAITAAAAEADALVMVLVGLGVVVFLAFIANFSVLTTTVSATTAQAAFGRGWPRKKVDLSTVTAAGAVRNAWFYGWGIRWIPKGSLWNVWGLDAVEFTLASGRVVRFGTDDADGLLLALTGRVGSIR